MRVGLILALTATVAGAQPTVMTRMATGKDVTFKLARNQRCKWFDGRTATQPERAAMYLKGVATLMAEGLLYAKYTKPCASVATGTSASNLETEDTRLRVYYVDENRNPTWAILGDNGCPDYEHANDLAERLRACSTANAAAKVACGASPYMTAEMLDWTDMRKQNGQCEKGALFTVPAAGAEIAAVAETGRLDYRVPLPPLTTATKAALRNLVVAHHASDAAFCEGRAAQPGAVQAASLELLTSSPDPTVQHAMLLEFTPVRDEGPTGWTRQEHCDWNMLKGAAMHAWAACVTRPAQEVWPCLTRARSTHETLHRCAALKNAKKVRIESRAKVLGDDALQLTSQPMKTCADWLRCARGELPDCRPPWIPADWRVIITPGTM